LFAGTDESFALIPDVFQQILFENAEFLPHLRNLLLYSVTNGEVLVDNLAEGALQALNSEDVQIALNPFRVNGLTVIAPDNDVGNGVVQIIDDVLTPAWVGRSLSTRIAEDPDLSILNEFVVLSGLDVDLLSEIGTEFTFFAPVNSAWEALPPETLAGLRAVENVDSLRALLAYHVGVGIFVSSEFFPRRIDTFEGGFLTVAVSPLRINQATVLTVDMLANNGVLHRIDRLLEIAQGVRGESILDFVADNPDLSLLFALLERAGFSEPLSLDGTFTFFAPVNAAFAALPQPLQEILFSNDEFILHLQNLLLYHLLGAEVFEAAFADERGTALNNEPIRILTSPLRINTFPVITPDNDATNGVTHTLDGALLPSWVFNSLTTRVEGAAALSILGEFLVFASIDLNAGGALTLFGPRNDAWNALGETRLEELRNDSQQVLSILAYHAVSPIFTAFELSANLVLTTFQGGTITVTKFDPQNGIIRLNEVAGAIAPAGLVGFDILAFNGVLHVIDTVLDPADSPAA
jgi:uncharacterized surface protein with fasciclin (FAS1) repeats